MVSVHRFICLILFSGSKQKQLVPVLFTEECVPAINLLLEHRLKFGIASDNKLVFACGNATNSLRGWDSLQRLTKDIELDKPKLITPTRTRKQVSTMMQLMDLTEAELTWITNHMGHTKDVQMNWYRKEDSTIELTKVARTLLQVDVGSRDDLQNKKISDLHIGEYSSSFFDFFSLSKKVWV